MVKNNELYINTIWNDDCLSIMENMPEKIFDMILCDLPYGITNIDWDNKLDLNILWKLYKKILKNNGVIILTASQPYTSELVISNLEWFKYELIWEKTNATSHMLAKLRPLKAHENILVFYEKQPTYNPQMEQGKPYFWNSQRTDSMHFRNNEKNLPIYNNGKRYPRSIKKIKQERGLHPTQKPVELFEWLIKTYTNENDLVLDNCAGSGTTAIACKRTNRNYCLIEKEEEYYKIIIDRIKNERRTIY